VTQIRLFIWRISTVILTVVFYHNPECALHASYLETQRLRLGTRAFCW